MLVGSGLEWLVDGVALANEILVRDFERQITGPIVEQRLRRIRVRYCERVTLSVDGFEVEETLPFYAFADDTLPTLVIGDDAALDWSTLSDAAAHLSNLLDRRMRWLEMLLLRLAAKGRATEPTQRPSDDMLARAGMLSGSGSRSFACLSHGRSLSPQSARTCAGLLYRH